MVARGAKCRSGRCIRQCGHDGVDTTTAAPGVRSHARAGSRRPTQTCLRFATGISSATPRALLSAARRALRTLHAGGGRALLVHGSATLASGARLPRRPRFAGRVTRWFEMPVRQRMQGWQVGLAIVARSLLDSYRGHAHVCGRTRERSPGRRASRCRIQRRAETSRRRSGCSQAP
jgi:hypothetical protein